MRLLDTRAAAAPGRESRTYPNPVLRAAVLSCCAAFLCACVLVSPWFRVSTVVWTGSHLLDPERCKRIEDASLGQSLLLLPERELRLHAHDASQLNIRFEKHFPNTLEVSVVSRFAVACTEEGEVLDGRGRWLEGAPAEAGLTRLSGFTLRAGNLDARGLRVLEALEELRALPALRTQRVERQGDDVVFTLARTGTQVRLRLAALDAQLHKLRVYEQSLGTGELPAHIDLRFRHQVVVRAQTEGTPEDG